MEHGPGQLRDILHSGISALGLPDDEEALERWAKLAQLLERWSERINLTGHRGAVAIAQRLLLEAAALGQVLPPAASIADLGSGAGIPGLPLAICRPHSQIWMIEARERRHHFQRAAIRELGLANAFAIHGRSEQLEIRPSEGVVSQAFAHPDAAVAEMTPWAIESGWIAVATTPDRIPRPSPETTEGEIVPYSAPGGPVRAVWIARLHSEPRS